MPTLGALSGGAVPAGIDGISIVDTLMGKTQAAKEYLYWTWPGAGKAEAEAEDSVPALKSLGWQAIQDPADGTLAYVHLASGVQQAESPLLPSGISPTEGVETGVEARGKVANGKGKKTSGYGIRMGDWKGVVDHCADTVHLKPSANDAFQVYHLPSDPFESTDVAKSAKGKAAIAKFVAQLKAADVSCKCFQC